MVSDRDLSQSNYIYRAVKLHSKLGTEAHQPFQSSWQLLHPCCQEARFPGMSVGQLLHIALPPSDADINATVEEGKMGGNVVTRIQSAWWEEEMASLISSS